MDDHFDGGELSSDGGLILIRRADRRLGLIKPVAGRLSDKRQRGKVRHEAAAPLRQRAKIDHTFKKASAKSRLVESRSGAVAD